MNKDKLLSLIVDVENSFGQLYGGIAIFGLVTNDDVRKEADKLQQLLDKFDVKNLKELVEQL